jgi:SAM-dependent methyltransferase
MTALELDAVIDRLGYGGSDDLVRKGDALEPLPVARRYAWNAAHERVGVDAAFFEGRVPLVYFAGLNLPSEDEVEHAVAVLHQRTWNQSRAQLLVVVLPTEIRILDGRSAPRTNAGLVIAESIGDTELERFTLASLLGGRAQLPTSRREKPVVLQLRADLRPAREKLLGRGLTMDMANQLLARCLFAQYLDARALLRNKSLDGHQRFLDRLNESLSDTYALFDRLHERFNGDTFIVTKEERRAVKLEHLQTVASFLEGSAGTDQLTLVPRYDFSVIPAEVLGGVYEEFVRDDQKRNAAFYTPGHLVDAALDHAMPITDSLDHARVLDPACGSGLFLARAYERLLDQREEKIGRALSPAEMAQLLADQVFGCDLMEDALRVAALSCYLVLLDRLTKSDDTEAWQFPQMIGPNLHQGDFFDVGDDLEGSYEVIASNPPWKGATDSATRYLQKTERPAGSKQTLAEAFFWIGLDRLSPDGRLALLMPAASLYKQSPKERAFQLKAIADGRIDVLIEFSAFRHQLFADAIAPCALFVARGTSHDPREHITFATPKPGPVSIATGRIAVDADRITRVPRRALRQTPGLLRQLLFGDMRDAQLIDRLCHQVLKVGDLSKADRKDHWTAGLGYQIKGGRQDDLPLLREIPAIDPDDLVQFGVSIQEPINAEYFHRPRKAELYEGPRVLLARAVDPSGRVHAAYYESPASYSETIIGFVPPARRKIDALALCAFLNSSLARYLLFMTGSSWGIERPQLKQQDVAGLPVPFLEDRETIATLAKVAASASPGDSERAVAAIDECLIDFFGLEHDELALIKDRLEVQLSAYNDPLSTAAYGPPRRREIERYQSTLQRTLRAALATEAVVDVKQSSADLVVTVGFAGAAPAPKLHGDGTGWLAVPSETLLLRRPQRTYGRDWCELRKLSERKEVTTAAALHDADEIVGELLRAATRSERPDGSGQ